MVFGRALASVFAAAAAAVAAGPDYFPLHQGNQWVYRCSGACAEPLAVAEIAGTAYLHGRWYSHYRGLGTAAWLRQDAEGSVWAFDPATGTESRWYAFSASEGQGYATTLDPCSTRAAMASRAYAYQGPAGVFPETLRLVYSGPCVDAGLTEEVFYRWTGLMRRTETTVAGPRTWELIYARTGGVTVRSAPELSVSLTLDRCVYTANLMPPVDPATSIPKLTARLTVRNTTSTPVTLDLPDGIRFCMRVQKDGSQAGALSYSACSRDTSSPAEEIIALGEKNYLLVFRLATPQGAPLPEGAYTVTAWLSKDPDSGFSASAGFEVWHVY
jgi:hypothetical protein